MNIAWFVQTATLHKVFKTNVPDPKDPYVFRPPGSRSGSIPDPSIIKPKNGEKTGFLLFRDLFMTFYL
jgi:hypothetical protein